ncbi:ATP-binding protein [Bacteriovoracales bacterium]|nr:ATP-binding protein [Bacteriovoracales bacterium]
MLSLGTRLFFNNSYLDDFLENSGNLQFLINRRLEFISVFFLTPSLIGYTQHLFPSFMPKNFFKINLLASLLVIIFITFTEPITFVVTLPFMWGQAVLTMIVTIYVLIRESYRKTDYSVTFLLSFVICLIGGVQSALVTQHILPPPELFPIAGSIFVFIQSSILSKKFSIAFRTAERLSKNLANEVKIQTKEAVDQKNRALASEKEVSNLLNTMKQSVFSVNEKGIIIPPVSRFSHDLFEKSIEGQSVFDILFKDYDKKGEFIDSFKFFLNVCIGADDLQYLLMRDQLPKKIKLSKEREDTLSLKIGYAPILDDSDKIYKIMLVVEDVTELEKKEKEAKDQEVKSLLKVKRLQEIVSNDKKELNIFIDEINFHILQIKNALKDQDLDAFFRTLHTLKGSSRAYGLSGLSSEIHLLENRIVPLKKGQHEKETILETLKSIHDDLVREIKNYISLIQEVYGKDVTEKVMNTEDSFIKLSKERFEKIMIELTKKLTLNNEFELLKKFKELQNERLNEILMNLEKVVDKMSLYLNKKIELKISGDEVFLDLKETSILKDSILHIIQNSCDHGIEKEGKILIDIKNENENIKIKVKDNGKGIDPDKILKKAIEKGVVSIKESSEFTNVEKLSLIMEAGFSTKVVTTEYSGRGVGMDVVKKNIESLGGFIVLDSEVNKGTTITLSLPTNKNKA